MTAEGYSRTGTQCKGKIKKLRADYRKIKDNNNETGRSRRSSKIFEAMNEILGCKPATRPPVLLESLSEKYNSIPGINEENDSLHNSFSELPTPANSFLEEDFTELHRPTNSLGDNSPAVSSKKKAVKRRHEQEGTNRGRKDKMKDVMESMLKGLKEMKDADASLLLELEDKRMRYEDQRLKDEREYEEKRRMQEMEFEDRRRREERAFQLQMMQQLTGSGNGTRIPCGAPWQYGNIEDQTYFGPLQQS
eukprot:m.27022 g.27022  ORF g.27022 m.27022 type:complete len:249 (+) comp29659_c0_seq1:52-798(+)